MRRCTSCPARISRGAFRVERGWSGDVLPPYTELIRFDVGRRLRGEELRAAARELLVGHLGRVVPGNPFDRFSERFAADLPGLLAGDAALYHAYTFATFRMAGAGFELLASEVEWLLGADGSNAIAAMSRIVDGCKVLGFKLARRRPFDPTEAMDALSAAWAEAMESLDDGRPLAAPRRQRPPSEPAFSGTTWCPSSSAGKRPCPQRATDPSPADLDGLAWIPAHVPGTAAGALRDAGREPGDLDAQDWWFRTTFEADPAEAGEELVLRLDGLATLAEVFLNGELVRRSESMFATHSIDIGARVRGRNELAIRFRALRPELGVQRRPRARWRTRLVSDNNLRWFRTMLLGRIPAFSRGPAAVGPWRPVWLERRRALVVEGLDVHSRLDGDDGVVTVQARLRGLERPARRSRRPRGRRAVRSPPGLAPDNASTAPR